LTYALIEGARAGGCRVFTHTRVTGIDVVNGRVRGVDTEWGSVEAEIVVNAGGMFAAELGRMARVRVPVVPFAHEYVVTQPFRERRVGAEIVHLPTLRDPDLLVYFREEGAGLVMGGYERHSAPWALDEHLVDRIPPDFNGRLLEEDWPRFEEIVAGAVKRVPQMEDVKITRLINGPEAFTPDNEFCLGESSVGGLFVAAGFCAHGLAGAGGIGKVMAEWIVAGEPALDVWEMDIRRFGPQYESPGYTLKRTREVYETYYDIRYPGHERRAGRPLRVSSAYAWHLDHDAAFGEKSGWERVNWYASNEALELLQKRSATTPSTMVLSAYLLPTGGSATCSKRSCGPPMVRTRPTGHWISRRRWRRRTEQACSCCTRLSTSPVREAASRRRPTRMTAR
jgi:hypothetical protein